jgi:hypothetical protein
MDMVAHSYTADALDYLQEGENSHTIQVWSHRRFGCLHSKAVTPHHRLKASRPVQLLRAPHACC